MCKTQVKTSSNADVKKLARYPHYNKESARIKSYETWPNTEPSAEDYAKAGFFYTGTGDLVRCFQCGIGLNDFSAGDDPLKEHIKHSDGCLYLNGMFGSKLKLRLQLKDIEQTKEAFHLRNTYTDPGCAIANSQFMTVESRMLTFKNTTCPFSQTPEALAAAGFYFIGPGDMVLCFSCQGGLSDWKENDDPWTEHCKWFPACAFAREIKGE
ncbi:hypothetical protein DPMN_053102 [Dreissena polymorpha]|uniref:Uncharacterized protein n=1 Tax=Dreissena polymorpha TaxID=45954 RepID=A0A9D4CKR4_DREPO|nr:hypothetical protein DPMN_053102 [Dreissena polymorpha]